MANEYTISKIKLPNGDVCNLKDTTYSAGAGLTLSNNTFSISNGNITNNMLAGSITKDKLENNVVKIFSRDDIGTSPNYDNPGVNGLFEIRSSTETTGETGTKPFNGFAPFLSLSTGVAMLQLAGSNTTGFYIRGKQSGNVTMANRAWQKIVTNSGTWDISISGSAGTAANVTGTVAIDHGGTGATSAAGARTNLGLGTIATKNTGDYLPITGGTLSGVLNLKWDEIDAKQTNNGISATTTPSMNSVRDKNNYILMRMESLAYTNGDIGGQWYIRNYDTSGNMIAQKGIVMKMDKAGNFTYTISEPYTFRTAIGLDTAVISKVADANTIENLVNELRYSNGQAGSFQLTTAYTRNNVTMSSHWYNYLWIPHRSGGANGAASGDNCNYGNALITDMNGTYGTYLLRYTSSAIAELDRIPLFVKDPTANQVLVADDVYGRIKTSGYTIATSVPSGAVFTDTKNTAGSTNSTSKLFLIGATSQAANPTTNSYQYTYTNNGLLSALKVGLNLNGTEKAHMEWNDTDQSIDFVFN